MKGSKCEIPSQNKDVCKVCDSSFWLHQKLNVILKFCKGCKNFACLDDFSDKPDASKCTKCRERGRTNYLSRKNGLNGNIDNIRDCKKHCRDSDTSLHGHCSSKYSESRRSPVCVIEGHSDQESDTSNNSLTSSSTTSSSDYNFTESRSDNSFFNRSNGCVSLSLNLAGVSPVMRNLSPHNTSYTDHSFYLEFPSPSLAVKKGKYQYRNMKKEKKESLISNYNDINNMKDTRLVLSCTSLEDDANLSKSFLIPTILRRNRKRLYANVSF